MFMVFLSNLYLHNFRCFEILFNDCLLDTCWKGLVCFPEVTTCKFLFLAIWQMRLASLAFVQHVCRFACKHKPRRDMIFSNCSLSLWGLIQRSSQPLVFLRIQLLGITNLCIPDEPKMIALRPKLMRLLILVNCVIDVTQISSWFVRCSQHSWCCHMMLSINAQLKQSWVAEEK